MASSARLGTGLSPFREVSLLTVATSALVTAMTRNGVRRLVCISALGVGDSQPWPRRLRVRPAVPAFAAQPCLQGQGRSGSRDPRQLTRLGHRSAQCLPMTQLVEAQGRHRPRRAYPSSFRATLSMRHSQWRALRGRDRGRTPRIIRPRGHSLTGARRAICRILSIETVPRV